MFSGAYTARLWLRSTTDSSSAASGRSRTVSSSLRKSVGRTFAHGGMRSWNSLRNSSRSRSEEHTSELQSLMRISYAVFCLKKKTETTTQHQSQQIYRATNKYIAI